MIVQENGKMKKLITTCLILLIAVPCFGDFAPAKLNDSKTETVVKMPAFQKKPLIQMAILLDTSGSMSGLIDQARTELWTIVNEFIFARRCGLEPEVQVALYEYGKSTISSEKGYIRKISDFTTDLDKISEELFALKTNGGYEYCGWVIKEATSSLNWSHSPDDLKVIFIAGNEPFTQGPEDYRRSCRAAVSNGIIVNTIHCGSKSAGINGRWKDGAILADGRFMTINHNRRAVHIEAPQDKQISELGVRLNDTYLAYGSSASSAVARQKQQDTNAANSSREAVIQRSVTKASANYLNYSWDLVDAIKNKKLQLKDIDEKNLPAQMQKMDQNQRHKYVAKMAAQRSELQKKVQQLNEGRRKYIAEQMKKQSPVNNTLGSAMVRMIREQAGKRNFTFESTAASKTGEKQNEAK